MRPRALVAVGALLLASAGCRSSSSLYDWGDYPDSLYRSWVEEGATDPGKEANLLASQVEQTRLQGRRVPPGLEAHIGCLCWLAGDAAGAQAHLAAEKESFPESTEFVDRLLSRVAR